MDLFPRRPTPATISADLARRPEPCAACGATGHVEREVHQGVPMWLCLDYRACCIRWECQ